jgi:hypothetical protein
MARSWEITDEAAESLAKSGNNIFLVCLRQLSVTAARYLASSKAQYLCLDSVEELSDEVIEALAAFKGGHLSLGILNITETQAELLSKYSACGPVNDQDDIHNHLALNGLTDISPAAVSHLVKMASIKKFGLVLELNGLATLSSEVATELENFGCHLKRERDVNLQFASITELTPEAAHSLSKIEGGCGLTLDSVVELSVDTCEFLASIKGASQIRIEGLSSLSIEAAKALVPAKSQIYLNVSPSFSDEVKEALVKGEGRYLSLSTYTGWYGDDED